MAGRTELRGTAAAESKGMGITGGPQGAEGQHAFPAPDATFCTIAGTGRSSLRTALGTAREPGPDSQMATGATCVPGLVALGEPADRYTSGSAVPGELYCVEVAEGAGPLPPPPDDGRREQ